jgi:hypothetical protein
VPARPSPTSVRCRANTAAIAFASKFSLTSPQESRRKRQNVGMFGLLLTTTSAPVEDSGFAWPVLIVGGLIIVAGLVATRGEFRNWRQRRVDRD